MSKNYVWIVEALIDDAWYSISGAFSRRSEARGYKNDVRDCRLRNGEDAIGLRVRKYVRDEDSK